MRVIEGILVEHESNALLKSFLDFLETYDSDSVGIEYKPNPVPGLWALSITGKKAGDVTKAAKWVKFVAKKNGIMVVE
jgi:hypothetical protein